MAAVRGGRTRRAAQSGPTLEEVARRAGVGRGTASRVINGSPRVSDRTRAAVEDAVAELGYVPNRVARALAAGSADTVALVVPEPERRFFSEPYFPAIVRGISSELASADMQLLLTLLHGPKERDRFAQYAAAHRIDGVLLVSVHADHTLPDLLARSEIPAVLGGRRRAAEPVPYVDCDNTGGARTAVAHLLERGRGTVATVTGPQDVYAARCRADGYREALRDADVPLDTALLACGEFTEEGGGRAMRQLLERTPGLDAVFCASDVMAVGARRVLREAGRTVPDDVAIVGFDDSVVARHMDPPLTTVRQPIAEMGRQMTRVLLELLGKGTPGRGTAAPRPPAQGGDHQLHRVLPTELIARASS
jgi:DNA-binding LacI/PurR family transcriptional regulator